MKFDLGVGPMSLEVIDAVVEYANAHDTEIMLIASRNQVESGELGGGYVNNFSSADFSQYVRGLDINKKIMICRDHSGPFLRSGESSLSLEEATELSKISIEDDIRNGFDLIHIDTSACPDPYFSARQLFEFAIELKAKHNPALKFEFGSEENIGVGVSPTKFENDVKFIKSIINPEFVVGQTGSLVRSIYQVGVSNAELTARLVQIADDNGVRLKEHNADYIDRASVQRRYDQRIGAINVAPEFGYIQTRELVKLAKSFKLDDDLAIFKRFVIEQKKWMKWSHGNFTDDLKFLSSAHYSFTSDHYYNLIDKINKHINFANVIKISTFELLDMYTLKN